MCSVSCGSVPGGGYALNTTIIKKSLVFHHVGRYQDDVVASEAAKIQSHFYRPCRRRHMGPLVIILFYDVWYLRLSLPRYKFSHRYY